MLRIAIPTFFALFTLTTQAQISNNSFETVDITPTDTVPDGWMMDDFGSGISTNAHGGNYAVSVWNWYWYGKGIVYNGSNDFTPLPFKGQPFLYGGEPISFKPVALHGFYLYDTLYTTSNNDTALVQITLSRFNTFSGEREAVGLGEAFLTWANQYEPFIAHVNYTSSLMPDTVTISVMSSLNGMCGSMTSGVCLYLTIDDLTLETASGVVDFAHKSEPVRVYPNPAETVLNIDAVALSETAVNCELISIGGHTVLQQTMTSNKTTLNISGLETGMYFYRLRNEKGHVLFTGKAEVTR